MSVSVDGVPRYRFAVSTGRAGYGTPSGTYRPQRLAASWFSKLYYNSPMPHSIFFHGGYAIHGSYEINRAWWTRLTRLHPPAPCERRSAPPAGENAKVWRQRPSSSPAGSPVLASRPAPSRDSLMRDGRRLLMRIATDQTTDGPTTTGVRSRGRFRSSIRADAASRLPLVCGRLAEFVLAQLSGAHDARRATS